MKATVENLMTAEQLMSNVVAELREAYSKSEPLVEIIVLPLLEDAVEMEKRLKALNKALHHGNSGGEQSWDVCHQTHP